MFLTTHLHKFFNFLKRYSILKKYLSILTSVVLIVLLYSFIAKGVYILDPDFGWHYKLGEIIAVTGIPETDPFSYTMPSFPFIAHEWLTSYFIFRLLDKSGFVGLSIISAFFVFIALSLSLLRLPGSKFGYNLFSEYDQIFSKKSFFIGPITLLGLASLLPLRESGLRYNPGCCILCCFY
jgi:hypothetical protein